MAAINDMYEESPVRLGKTFNQIAQTKPSFGSEILDLKQIDDYKIIKLIAQGTYGMVYKCSNRTTNEMVAAKKLTAEKNKMEEEAVPDEVASELEILSIINHKNVIHTIDMKVEVGIINNFFNIKERGFQKSGVFIIMEYMEHDLGGVISSKMPLSNDQIQAIIKQILEGLQYIHTINIIHRDIKCSNILMNNMGIVKIGDFGLSKRIKSIKDFDNLTKLAVTMAYRPPEIILRDVTYSFPIDLWSTGCILIMLHTKIEPFIGLTEKDVLKRIFEARGAPNQTNYPQALELPRFKSFAFKYTKKRNFHKALIKYMNEDEAELTKRLLTIDPNKRITAGEALGCEWLKNVNIHTVSPPNFKQEYRDRFVTLDLRTK